MFEKIPEQLKILAEECSVPLYIVGGTCRDYLAGMSGGKRDFDLCAPVGADEFARAAKKCGFEVCAVYRNTGTMKLKSEGEEYEFTCFRSDDYVRGTHVPVKIFFTDDIVTDARRRDFKMNAVYYDIKGQRFVDPLGGMEDIKERRVTTVREADRVFGEDGLRLMRLARQAASVGFTPTEECLSGARKNSSLINDISAERIWAELNAILHADGIYGLEYAQYNGLEILKESGVLHRILPELCLGEGMEQRQDFHAHDVLEHSLRCVKYADGSVRLAALLHDVGKPYCKIHTGVFHNHEEEGERIAREVCERWKVPKALAAETCRLIALHMYDIDLKVRDAKIKRLIIDNYDIFDKLLLLKQADFSACKDDLSEAPCAAKWRALRDKMKREGVPVTIGELAVRGGDLTAAGVPRENVGKTLKKLLEACAIEGRPNEKEILIAAAVRMNGGE